MGVASKYNKGNGYNFTIPKEYKYESLSDLFNNNGKEKIYLVKALYINKKSKYGESPIVATDFCLVNLPKHMTETVVEMMRDSEATLQINSGKLGFQIYTYESQGRNDVFYSINWVDL